MPHNPAWLVNLYPNDLKSQIRELVQHGYAVTVQDKETAQLVRKKSFSFIFAFVTGFIPYLCYYLWKRDSIVYLDVTTQKPDPNWKRTESSPAKTMLKVAGIAFGAIFLMGIIAGIFQSS